MCRPLQRRARLPGERPTRMSMGPQCWIRPPTGTAATWPVAGSIWARARPMSTSDDRRRRMTSGIGVQTDSATSPFGSGRSWPAVIRAPGRRRRHSDARVRRGRLRSAAGITGSPPQRRSTSAVRPVSSATSRITASNGSSACSTRPRGGSVAFPFRGHVTGKQYLPFLDAHGVRRQSKLIPLYLPRTVPPRQDPIRRRWYEVKPDQLRLTVRFRALESHGASGIAG